MANSRMNRKASVDDLAEFIITIVGLVFVALIFVGLSMFNEQSFKVDVNSKTAKITAGSELRGFLQTTINYEGKDKKIADLILETEDLENGNYFLLTSLETAFVNENVVSPKIKTISSAKRFDENIGQNRWFLTVKYYKKDTNTFTDFFYRRNQEFHNFCSSRNLETASATYYIPKPKEKNNANVVEVMLIIC